MRPTLFDILEDPGRWEAMKGDDSDKICDALKLFLIEINDMKRIRESTYHRFFNYRLEMLEKELTEIAKPYIEELEQELALGAEIDSKIHESKILYGRERLEE